MKYPDFKDLCMVSFTVIGMGVGYTTPIVQPSWFGPTLIAIGFAAMIISFVGIKIIQRKYQTMIDNTRMNSKSFEKTEK